MAADNYWTTFASRRMSRRRFVGAAAAGSAALALAACGGGNNNRAAAPAATSGAPASATRAGTAATAAAGAATSTAPAASATKAARKLGGTLKVGNPTMMGQFEPNISTTSADWGVNFAIYDTLFVATYSGEIQPALATGWEANNGQIMLKLRPGVKFHDGTPFTASSVKRNVERTLKLGAQSRVYSQWSAVQTIEAPDDATVVVKLTAPQYAPLVANMATIAGAMPSPDAIEKLGQDYQTKPVGTGPYKVDSVALDSRVNLVPFKEYSGMPENGPYLDNIEFHIIGQASALVTAMQAGEIDLLYYIGAAPAGDLDQLKPNSNITIIAQPGHGFQEFRLYRGRPPFDNTDLVDAFGYAIDRKAILAGIYGNVGQVAGGPVNPASWAWDPNFKGFAIDDVARDAQVKQHLQKAGMPSGFALNLDYSGTSTATQEAVAKQLEKYGIKATLMPLPATAGSSPLYEGNFTALASITPQYSPDPDSIFRPNFHSKGQFNYHKFSNAQLDALLDQAGAETDQAKRKTMYQDAQKLVFDSGIPRIPLIYPQYSLPVSKKVRDAVLGFEGSIRVGAAWLG